MMNTNRRFDRLDRLARILDSAVTVPGTSVKVGLDPILGLFPGIGDGISSFLSGVILFEAARAGAPKRSLLRMLGNVIADALVGAVPVLGDIFDFAFRANERNMQLLRAIPASAFLAPRSARAVGTLIITLLVLILGLVFFCTGYIAHAVFARI